MNLTSQNPLASSVSGKQYRLVSASTTSPLSVSAAATVTANYQTQWQVSFKEVDQSSATIADASGTVVTVNGAAQTTNPYSAFFDQGSNVNFTSQNPLASSVSGKQYRLLSASTTSPLSVSAAATVTANYQTQWQVSFKEVDQSSATIADASGTVVTVNGAAQTTNPYSAFFDQGSNVTFTSQNPLASSVSGKQYRLVSASTTSPLSVSAASTVTANYQTQWQVSFKEVDQSSATIADASGTVVTVNGAAQTTNPYSAFFDQGSNVNFTSQNPLASSVSGKQYRLLSASTTSPLSVSAAATVTGHQTQWQVSFKEVDQSSATIADASGTVVTVNGAAQTTNPYSAFFSSTREAT